LDENHQCSVLAAFELQPHASIRMIASQTDISCSSVYRILHQNSYHPYKIHYVQGLKPTDPIRRLDFISHMVVLHEEDENILSKILWTDESCFNNNGIVNRRNSHFWSKNNPHWTRETNAQIRWSINVWCGIFNNQLIGPYFYDGTLTGLRYLDFLVNILPDLMADVPDEVCDNMWFQQDGAPPHNANVVKDHLNQQYPSQWFGTNGPVKWPPRSPDLTPLDFFLWGYLKDKVYEQQSKSLIDLKERITAACRTVTTTMLKSVIDSIIQRYEKCLENDGGHFENLL